MEFSLALPMEFIIALRFDMGCIGNSNKKEFKDFINFYFKNIGPKSKLKYEEKNIYSFEDDIYFGEVYFGGGSDLKIKILDNIPKYKGKINYSSSYQLFGYICKFIYNRIKSRVKNIDDTLETYLKDEDISAGLLEIENKLKQSYGVYRIYLITNLIYLKNIKTLQFGNVNMNRVDEDSINWFPEKIEYPFKSSLAKLLVIDKALSREELLKEYKNNVILETRIKGYHISSEKSDVVKSAFFEYRQVFSYLIMCKGLLGQGKFGKDIFETKEIDQYAEVKRVIQICYVGRDNNLKQLKFIDTAFEEFKLSEKQFIINKEVLQLIKEKCYLSNFNDISQDIKYGDMREKIRRSMDWFLKAKIEKDFTDKAISLFISLETLLSTGPDPLSSQTDDLAENVVIITHAGEERYEVKKYFKKEIYGLRNQIMHRGYSVNLDTDLEKISRLEIYVIYSIRAILGRINEIIKYGKDSNALKEYFERKKLK